MSTTPPAFLDGTRVYRFGNYNHNHAIVIMLWMLGYWWMWTERFDGAINAFTDAPSANYSR
jgi:hypothetical protein